METILKVKVRQMASTKSYREVPNQFIITTPDGEIFQSYRSVIAFKPFRSDKQIVLDREYWNYSRTTGKYRNAFLGENTADTQKKINSGEYILADLNNH